MPKRFFRLLAVLLLALTIPVQGMAGVTAGQCMAAGHHQKGAGQENQAHKHDGADEYDGAGAHHQASHSHSDESAPAGEDGKSAHCGPCTACCASASIAGPAGVSITSSPLKAKYVSSQLPPPGVQPDGLDRPPLAL